MEPKFMGITSLPRTATQGPLNVPRETIPQFQQGGGLFATAPGLSIDTTPTFNLNLAPQGLSDPRQPVIIPTEETMYFSPQVPASSGLSLVDPATILPSLLPSENLGDMEPIPVASPDRMYGTPSQIGSSLDLMGVGFVPNAQAMLESGNMFAVKNAGAVDAANQRAFDNAMDTAMDRASKAQALNVLYGGAGSSFESGRNEYTESGQYDRDREARQAAFDAMRAAERGDKPPLTPIETARALADLQARIGFGGAMAPANNPTITIPERVEPTTQQLPFDLISGYNRRISPEEAYTIIPGPADPGITPQGIAGLGGRGVGTAKKAMGGGIMSLNPNY
tara:strand:+ start:7501 stop:8511 length:1011 start_codon:yes stop_codon:yes gene_type:complete